MKIQRHNQPYLYKYRSAEDAERILTQRTIRCSHPANFNDLLDGQVSLRLPALDSELREKLFREYVRLVYLEPPPSLRDGSTAQSLVRLWRALAGVTSRDNLESMMRQAISTLDSNNSLWENKAGEQIRSHPRGPQVLCLAEHPTSMPMWYHYAEQYRGVVLAFDCQSDAETMFGVAQKVEYVASIPQVCDTDEWVRMSTGQAAISGVLQRQFLTKSDEWKYEQEWRVFAGLGPPGSISDVSLISAEFGGIIIGLKTDKAVARRLIDLAKTWRQDCLVWQAHLDFSSYGFRLEGVC